MTSKFFIFFGNVQMYNPAIKLSLLKDVWICNLQVHQKIATWTIDVATVTLKNSILNLFRCHARSETDIDQFNIT